MQFVKARMTMEHLSKKLLTDIKSPLRGEKSGDVANINRITRNKRQ